MTTTLEQALRAHARRFQASLGPGLPRSVRLASDEAVDRLISWSASNASALTDRGPEGTDPAFGVAPAGGIATVWRIYPRKSDGGKVTLLSKAEHLLTAVERERITEVIDHLQPPKKTSAGQRLEIGLRLLAADSQWAQFVKLLPTALAVAKRHRP